MEKPWDARFEAMMRKALRFVDADDEIHADLNTAAAGMDSMSVVELLIEIESAYDISMPDELLEQETFATPASLWKAISTVRASRDADPG